MHTCTGNPFDQTQLIDLAKYQSLTSDLLRQLLYEYLDPRKQRLASFNFTADDVQDVGFFPEFAAFLGTDLTRYHKFETYV